MGRLADPKVTHERMLSIEIHVGERQEVWGRGHLAGGHVTPVRLHVRAVAGAATVEMIRLLQKEVEVCYY